MISHFDSLYDVEISYDNIQFIVPISRPKYTYSFSISPIIHLFNINPYEQISQNDDNKFFYILIYTYINRLLTFYIQKPIIFTDILKFKTINVLPNLINNIYYYKIKIPKGDYYSLLIETTSSYEDIKMSLSKDNIQYPIAHINLRGYSDNLIIYNINNDKDLYLYY